MAFGEIDRDLGSIRLAAWGRVVAASGPVPFLVVDGEGRPVEPIRWFLRDFGYNTDLLRRDELDEKALLGLQGIVRVSHTVLNGHSFLNFDGFAPAADWEEFTPATSQEAGHDL